MNSAKKVNELVESWAGLSKEEIIVRTATAEIGWCYVWGATGQECNPSRRKVYANNSNCPAKERKEIVNKCQVLNGSEKDCTGCKYYPDSPTLMDDCQGFVKQVCKRVGITFSGGGCTTMWDNAKNWEERGEIQDLPEQVCCVFWTDANDPKTKSHIGFYIGNGWMIHCSGEVIKEKLSNKCTHWAIPKGIDCNQPTLRKGSSGQAVVELQTRLIQLGYDLKPYGADGKFGAKTLAAVKAFQGKEGLTVDGVVGVKTWNALLKEQTFYTVKVEHLSELAAEEIIKKYGGTMTKEGGNNA